MNSNNIIMADDESAPANHLIDNITCSIASRNDLPQVQALLSEYGLPYEDVGEHIEHFLLARDNGTLVGTVGVELLGRDGLLRSLCVSSHYRNRAIASELCKRIEVYSRNAGVRRLYLLTTTANDFFAHRGYSVCSRESLPSTLQGTAEFRFLCPCTAVCMVQSLYDFNQVINDLLSLNQTIKDNRWKIVKVCEVSFESQDARHVALNGLQCDICACVNWMRVLMSLKGLSQEKYSENWEEEYLKLIGTGLSSGQAEDLMVDYLRHSLILKTHFKIENLFSNILKVLIPHKDIRVFEKIRDTMFEQAGISKTGPEKNILTILTNLRNSFHNNGMHNKEDFPGIDIDGIRFEFIKGKKVECASWEHIIVIIRENISVLASVLFSENVSSIRSEIPDAFAACDNP
jgi:amino-acid N-acetyltransferase